MKLKTMLGAFVLFGFALGSCKDCFGRTTLENAQKMEDEAETAQAKAESVRLADENAENYWGGARDAWLKAEEAWVKYKNEKRKELARAEDDLRFGYRLSSWTEEEKAEKKKDAERRVKRAQLDVKFGKKKEDKAKAKVWHARNMIDEARDRRNAPRAN